METALSFLLDSLPQLIQLVKSELIDFPSEVESKIRSLQTELDFMNDFVKSARKKQRPHQEVSLVVRKIMEVAQQAENLIDTYFYNLIRHSRKNRFKQFFDKFDHQLGLHDVDNSIADLNKRIKEILENRSRYGLEEGVSNEEDAKAAADQMESVHRKRREVEENDVIGFDKYSEEVIKLIKDGDSSPRKVVSIYGMPGLGKTTLARKIYNDHQLGRNFDIVSWAYVSKEFRPREILLALLSGLKSITEGVANFDSMSLADLKSMVEGGLRDMRYLIVLDDLWEKKQWDEIQDCFPNENNGSRILITSRDRDVVNYASRTPYFKNQTPLDPYELQPLDKADSWKLFCKRVFHEETCSDPVLEPYAINIVESCKNLPLSIVVAAGLLQDKTLPKEWSDIAENINWFINEDGESQVKEILKLSYNSLREELKPCFLYFGLYPVDSEIPVRQLIQQWIAEGFIQVQQTGAEAPEPEVVAEKHLRELIGRSLIQVVKKRTDGGVKTCRIHDLLRDLCIDVSKEEEFFEICRDASTMKRSKPRKLSLHCSTESYHTSNPCDHSSARSLFCFRQENFSFYGTKELEWFLNEFKLVRVLDLGPRNSYFADHKLDNFIYLRYLRAETLWIQKKVSDSIRDLWNLETLDLKGWSVGTLHHAIWNLKRLRHVYLDGSVIIPKPSKGAKNKKLGNLQTISTIALHHDNVFLLEKGMFPKLRKLGFKCSLADREAIELLQRLKCLTHLNTLKIIFPSDAPTSANGFPQNVTKITLKKVHSSDIAEFMKILADVPFLRILKLLHGRGKLSPSDSDLCFAAGGFQRLQVFQMEELGHENLTLKNDAIPQLQRLIIKNCKELKGLPSELLSLKSLAEVEISWPSTEMADMLKNLKTEDIKLKVYPPLDEESNPSDD